MIKHGQTCAWRLQLFNNQIHCQIPVIYFHFYFLEKRKGGKNASKTMMNLMISTMMLSKNLMTIMKKGSPRTQGNFSGITYILFVIYYYFAITHYCILSGLGYPTCYCEILESIEYACIETSILELWANDGKYEKWPKITYTLKSSASLR